MKRISGGTATLLAGALLVATPVAALADYSPSDFPSSAEVGDAIGRGGSWDRYLSKNYSKADWVLGARPAQCASDGPFAAATDNRSASYGMMRSSTSRLGYNAQVAIYKFPSEAKARAALTKVQAHVRSCPSYTEWVCTQCDGIFDVWQRLSPIPNAGDRTVAWAGKLGGNVGERYRSAAVLDRDNIIKVSVSIFGDAGGSRFPSVRPTKPELRELAETAYSNLP